MGGFVREFTQRVYLARGKLDRMSVDESAKKTTSVEMCVEDQFWSKGLCSRAGNAMRPTFKVYGPGPMLGVYA